MNYKNWVIISLSVLVLIFGLLLLDWNVDTAPDNNRVQNRWDCEEGCLYAEWVTYGYKTLDKPSELYNQCAKVCWKGDNYFK